MSCVGYYTTGGLTSGLKCTKTAKHNGRCGTHFNSVTKNGPRRAAIKEIDAVIKRIQKDYLYNYDYDMGNRAIRIFRLYSDRLPETYFGNETLIVDITTAVDVFKNYMREANTRAIQNHRNLVEDLRRQRQLEFEERLQRIADHGRQEENLARIRQVIDGFNPVQPEPQPPIGELAAFANDRQNIHTEVAVNQTIDMVNRILKISVPEEYRWNQETMSKTCGEIILDCNLPLQAANIMLGMYISNATIYNMGDGIYGKTLDGVWQYIRNSPSKHDLCKVLRQELVDNIGMCMQGNLTRICNILAGFMEGVAGVTISPAERLGNEMPKLLEIEDSEKRIILGRKLLEEVGLPQEEWNNWLVALEA